MIEFVVSTRGREPQFVDAENWLVALGRGLLAFGINTDIERLACERLPNGSVIARDVSGGVGFVVQEADDGPLVEVDFDESGELSFDSEVTTPGAYPRHLMLLEQVSYATSIGAAWQAVANVAYNLVHCQTAVVFENRVFENRGGGLFAVSIAGQRQAFDIDTLHIPPLVGALGSVVGWSRTVISPDPMKDKRFQNVEDSPLDPVIESVMGVPVIVGEGVVGVIALLNAPISSPFDPKKAMLVEEAAATLADRIR